MLTFTTGSLCSAQSTVDEGFKNASISSNAKDLFFTRTSDKNVFILLFARLGI